MIIRKYLGQIMSEMGFVTKQSLNEALQKQKKIIEEKTSSERMQWVKLVSEARLSSETDKVPSIGQILTDMKLVTKEQLEEALKEQEKTFEAYKSLDSEKLGIAIEIGSFINSTLDLTEVLYLIMRYANRVTNSVASTLMLLDDETGELIFCVPTGPKADKLIDVRLPPGEGIAGWVAKHEQPVLVPDTKEDSRFYSKIDQISGLETKSILCVPLKSKTKLVGVLEVINKIDGTSFTKEDELLLGIFGYQVAVALENARLHSELKYRLEDQKQVEAKLRQSEEKYRLLIMNIPCVVYKGFKDYTVEFFDRKIEQFSGYNVDEFNSGRLKWPDIVVEEDIVSARDSFIHALKTDKAYVREYRVMSKGGDIYWIQDRGHIVCEENGEMKYVSGVFFDITDNRRAEEELRIQRKHLEKQVAERSSDLKKVNESLQQVITERERADKERERLVREIQESLDKIKTLKGLLPICAKCKKIRDDEGYRKKIEGYVEINSEELSSYCLCEECGD